MNTKFAWPFKEPVDPEEYPEYYQAIQSPMDLKQIRRRLSDRTYQTKTEFLSDIQLMCSNCREFNSDPGNDYARCADKLERFVQPRVDALTVLKDE